jgi:dUTP pyrophosphatase
MPALLIRRVRDREPPIPLPAYQTAGSAGLDLSADVDAPVVIPPGERRLVPTGLAMQLPAGHEGQVRPRSGLALKHGVTVLNAPGTIDEDFTGEVGIVLVNHGKEPFVVERGMRIAQLVVAPVTRVEPTLVEALNETARGAGGYGSTGR